MAEDLHNPLNNPGADPVGQEPTPRTEAPEPDEGLTEFLDDFFESEPRDSLPESEPALPTEEPATPPAAVSPTPGEGELPQPSSATPDQQPVVPVEPTEPTQDDLQREVLQNLNTQLQRMADPPAQPQTSAPPPTPAEILQQLQPRIQQYVAEGWLNEDFVALYPEQAALQVYTWDTLQRGGEQLQQTQQFTQEEQQRRGVESANQQLNSAIDEVAARGEGFEALSADEVRQGFREFLINDVNPVLSQVTPDFLARQFYAYNHQLILDTVRQGAQGQGESQPLKGEATAAQLAQQEGSGARGTPSTTQQPDFIDLLEGTAAARWYQ